MPRRTENRRFIRHPTQSPIVCRRQGHRRRRLADLRNIGFGGMAFVSQESFAPGDLVTVEYPALTVSGLSGEVVWSGDLGDGTHRHLCGIRFLERSMFLRARLVEQLCHIEAYRRDQREKNGRDLTPNEAASEWIATTASGFPT